MVMVRRDVRQVPSALRAPRTGLLTVATVKDDETGVRWGNGVEWQAELPTHDYAKLDEPALGSDLHGSRAVDCFTVADIRTAEGAPVVQADPFQVFAVDFCSAMIKDRDRQGRARRLLEATQSHSIAHEFWTGAQFATMGVDTPWLGDASSMAIWPSMSDGAAFTGTLPDLIGTGCCPNYGALGRIDAYLTRVLSNGRGMLHMTPEMLSLLLGATSDWLRYEGGIYYTPNGHLVVADAGYTGRVDSQLQGQLDADAEWIIATPLVEVVLGVVETTPIDSSVFDRTVNDLVTIAQRDVLIECELPVAHAGFPFTNPFDIFA